MFWFKCVCTVHIIYTHACRCSHVHICVHNFQVGTIKWPVRGDINPRWAQTSSFPRFRELERYDAYCSDWTDQKRIMAYDGICHMSAYSITTSWSATWQLSNYRRSSITCSHISVHQFCSSKSFSIFGPGGSWNNLKVLNQTITMEMALRFRHRNGEIFLHDISRSSVRKFAELQDDFAKAVRQIFNIMYCYMLRYVINQLNSPRLANRVACQQILCGKHPCLQRLCSCVRSWLDDDGNWKAKTLRESRH